MRRTVAASTPIANNNVGQHRPTEAQVSPSASAHWRVSWCGWVRPLQNFAVILADQVTARQIERVDHLKRDDEQYSTTLEGSVRLIDSC